MGHSDHHVSFIPSDIVNAIGNSFPDRSTGKVIHMDFVRSTTPLVAWIFKPANQFLLLGIHANHWSASA
jgi:hypothetical protein